MSRSKPAALVTAAVALALVPAGLADAVYHTEQLALEPVGEAPGGGRVVNVHPNGPQVYAHEIYTLRHVLGGTEYVVRLWVHPFDVGCEAAGVNFAGTAVTTNAAGNAQGDLFIDPASVPAVLRGSTHGVRWDVTLNGVVQYATECTQVTLD